MTLIQQNVLAQPNKNYLFDLSDLGCLDVIGNQALNFLQGQLSCDVRKVTPNTMQQGAMCNLKGRVLALLDVIDWQGIHLILPNTLIADTLASLNKAASLSHVTLNSSTAYQLIGFYLQNQQDIIPFDACLPDAPLAMVYQDVYCCYPIGQGFYLFITSPSQALAIIQQFKQLNQLHCASAWHVLQLHQHRIQIHPQSRGLFLPHRLDLHKLNYLSFQKGCYKGQEIIARMHYRSKPKHEIKLFTLKTQTPPYIGQRLLAQGDDIELGELVDFERIGTDTYLLAASVVFDCPEQFRLQ